MKHRSLMIACVALAGAAAAFPHAQPEAADGQLESVEQESESGPPPRVSAVPRADEPAIDADAGLTADRPLRNNDFARRFTAAAEELLVDESFVPGDQLVSQLESADAQGLTVALNDAPRSRQEPIGPDELYLDVKRATLAIARMHRHDDRWVYRGASGGALLSGDGVFVTNFHVIDGDDRPLLVATADGRVFTIEEVIAASRVDDLAIARLRLPDGVRLHALPLRADAPTGEAVAVVHHPSGYLFMMTQGHIARYGYNVYDRGEARPAMQITAEYARGSSGCPVVDLRGNLLGIVSSTRSVYYDQRDQQNFQMTIRNCPTALQISQLIEATSSREP